MRKALCECNQKSLSDSNLPQSNSVSIIRIITLMFPFALGTGYPVNLRHFYHLSLPEECFL